MAATLVNLIMRLIQAIDPAMEVESGLNCSCPVTMQHAASTVVDHASSILRELEIAPHADREEILSQAKAILGEGGIGSQGGCKEFVRSRAAVDLLYFSSIRTVSDAVVGYIDGDQSAFTKLSEVIEELSLNERLLKGDVYESELRSHRLGLEGLLEARDRLHVDDANVIYCYPFAVSWADPDDLVDTANKWKDKEKWKFADQTASVEELELTDMWDGPAAHRFTGVSISFEQDPHIQTRAEEILKFSDDLKFSLEIRLSRLGNHYLRFQHRLEDASIHDLNQAMRRAMQQMGDERVTLGPPSPPDTTGRSRQREWPRLADLAEELIDSLADYLEQVTSKEHNHNRLEKHDAKWRATPPTPTGKAHRPDEKHDAKGPASPPSLTRKAHPHVIVTARKLSLERLGSSDGDPFRRDITVEELPEAKGAALLVQPVSQAAAILEEWSRYSLPDLGDGATMQPLSFVGNFAYRTTNTTCGLLRGTPEYLIAEHEEAAEFVASLPVLLESWMSQILERADTADLGHKPLPEDVSPRQLELRQLLTKATAVIAYIRSPELCLTAVHRKYLDQMFEIAGIERLERELRSHFAVLDAYLEILAAQAASREQKKMDMQGFFFGAGAVLVGVPSIAAVFALFDSGFAVHRTGDTVEALILTVLMILLFLAVFKLPGAKEVLKALHKWLKRKGRVFRRILGWRDNREANH